MFLLLVVWPSLADGLMDILQFSSSAPPLEPIRLSIGWYLILTDLGGLRVAPQMIQNLLHPPVHRESREMSSSVTCSHCQLSEDRHRSCGLVDQH